ncbi:MAG: hypothetical protein J6W75_00480 [Bacteroidaceae bacterium]|nr:hypothetical protein [Bacteroidaceae bacterium]
MLKELFEAHFYGTFSKVDKKVVMLEEKSATGDFSLLDPNACIGCKYVCNEVPEKREQLKVYCTQDVNIISIDQVFSFVRQEVGDICDFMLDAPNTTVLVETTCSTSEHVIGKRQKARGQLYNTLCQLYANPVVRDHIENNNVRYVVFSWKETFPEDREMDNIESSMKGMTVLTDVVYSPDNESKFYFDFKLKEIRYPDMLMV